MLSPRGTRLPLRMSPDVTVVIPAYNEAGTIAAVIESARTQGRVIVVDDGSIDATAQCAQHAGATVLRHGRNEGYDVALADGFKRAFSDGADIVLSFDADGEHDAGDITRLLEPIRSGRADLAVGKRPHLIHFAEKLFGFYTKLRFGVSDPLCGFKAYHRRVYAAVGHFDTIGSIGTGVMIAAMRRGYRVEEVAIARRTRTDDSRFYAHRFQANLRIIRALIITLLRTV